MINYREMDKTWSALLKKMEDFNIPIQNTKASRLSERTIQNAEGILGYRFPEEFRSALLDYAGSRVLAWELPDRIAENEAWQGMKKGLVRWNFDQIIPNNTYFLSDYFKDKFIFSLFEGGHFLCIDMSQSFQPVLYWDGEYFTYIANSFDDYLMKMTDFYFLSLDPIQMDFMLNEGHLQFEKLWGWRKGLSDFFRLSFKESKEDVQKLLIYAKQNEYSSKVEAALKKMEREDLFEQLTELIYYHRFNQVISERLAKYLGNIFKQDSKEWVLSMYERGNDVPTRLKSILLLYVCPEEALALTFQAIERGPNLTGEEMKEHLEVFSTREALEWLKPKVRRPTPRWVGAFRVCQPDWADIMDWLQSHANPQRVALHFLNHNQHLRSNNMEEYYLIPNQSGLSKEAVISLLEEKRNNEPELNRHSLIDRAIASVDLLWEERE